jgi:transposase-like protein
MKQIFDKNTCTCNTKDLVKTKASFAHNRDTFRCKKCGSVWISADYITKSGEVNPKLVPWSQDMLISSRKILTFEEVTSLFNKHFV